MLSRGEYPRGWRTIAAPGGIVHTYSYDGSWLPSLYEIPIMPREEAIDCTRPALS
jgi:hypothetical protein